MNFEYKYDDFIQKTITWKCKPDQREKTPQHPQTIIQISIYYFLIILLVSFIKVPRGAQTVHMATASPLKVGPHLALVGRRLVMVMPPSP